MMMVIDADSEKASPGKELKLLQAGSSEQPLIGST